MERGVSRARLHRGADGVTARRRLAAALLKKLARKVRLVLGGDLGGSVGWGWGFFGEVGGEFVDFAKVEFAGA